MATKQKAAIDRMVKVNANFQKAVKGSGYFCFTDSHRIFTDVKETYNYPVSDWEPVAKYAEEFLAMSNETAPVTIDRTTGKAATALLKSHIKEHKGLLSKNMPVFIQLQAIYSDELRKAAYNPQFIIDALNFMGPKCTTYFIRTDGEFTMLSTAIVFKSEDKERTAIILPIRASSGDLLPVIDFTQPIEAPPTPEKEPREVAQRRAILKRFYNRANKEARYTVCFDYQGSMVYECGVAHIIDKTSTDYGFRIEEPEYMVGRKSLLDQIGKNYKPNETALSIPAADLMNKLKAALESEKATINKFSSHNARVGLAIGNNNTAYVRAAWLIDLIRFVGDECKLSVFITERKTVIYIRAYDENRECFIMLDPKNVCKNEELLAKLPVIQIATPETVKETETETEPVIETQEATIETATNEKEETMSNNKISVKVYRYGMQHRGFSIGCQPKGVVGREDDPSGLFYDIINYEKPLSWKDCQDYELTPIGHTPIDAPEEEEEEEEEPEVVIEETAEEPETVTEEAAEEPKAEKVYTPRFCTVSISKTFDSKEAAINAGFTEPTYYEGEKYADVRGRSIDLYHMEFAAVKCPETEQTEEAEAAIEPEAATEPEAAIETPAEDPNAAKMAALTARCGQGFHCVGYDVGRFREKVFAVDIDGYTVTLRFAPESRAKKLGHHVLTATVSRDGQKVLVKDIGKPQTRRDFEYQIRFTKSINLEKLIAKAKGEEEAPIETPAPSFAEIVPDIDNAAVATVLDKIREWILPPCEDAERFDTLMIENAWFCETVSMFVEYRNAPLVGKECAAFAAAMRLLGYIGEGGATPPAPIEEPQKTTEEAPAPEIKETAEPVTEAPVEEAYVAAAKIEAQEARITLDPAAVEAVQDATETAEEAQAVDSPIEEENAPTEPQEAAYGVKYYPINEELARRSHEMMSYTDYKKGSKTAEYKGMVDKAYALAEEAAKARPSDTDRAYALADKYARKLADNMNHDSAIGTRCPSVMIAGPANFPTRKKEKQVAAWHKNMQEWNEIQSILDKIRAIKRGASVIRSEDADAIDQLQYKLETLKARQEKMREANKAIRMKNQEKGDARLAELGFSKESIKSLREPDFCGRIGFPAYELSNNNANIHRIEERIEQLSAIKERGTQETENEFFKVIENTEAMRLQIIFDEKPEPEVRNILKSNGFKWAPSQGAWQRHLTPDAKWALERVKTAIAKKEAV